MRFAPTTNGGRVVEGSTPYGVFRVEWDACGKLVRESLTISEPDPMATAAAKPVGIIHADFDPKKDAGCGCSPPVDIP